MSSKHRFATEEIEKFSTVDLIAELKRRYQVLSRPERSCVLVGAPFSGVATQAGVLRKEWGVCSIKREDFLPSPNVNLDEGIAKLSEEIGSFRCRRGFALQHFPSSESEAKSFDHMLVAKHENRRNYSVINLSMPHSTDEERDASTKELISRANGLLVHTESGRIYNSHVPDLAPQTPNVDDVSGEPLVCPKRDLTGLAGRIQEWWTKREPGLRSYYGERMQTVDAANSRDTVSMEVSKILLGTASSQPAHNDSSTSSP